MWLHECYVSTNFVADFSSQRMGSAKWTRTSSQGRDRGGSHSLCTFSCWSEAKEVRRAPHTRVRAQEETFPPTCLHVALFSARLGEMRILPQPRPEGEARTDRWGRGPKNIISSRLTDHACNLLDVKLIDSNQLLVSYIGIFFSGIAWNFKTKGNF